MPALQSVSLPTAGDRGPDNKPGRMGLQPNRPDVNGIKPLLSVYHQVSAWKP